MNPAAEKHGPRDEGAPATWTGALQALPLVAILRGLRPAEAPGVGQALWQAGWRLMEVPLNSPEPLRSIEAMARALPGALVGAGTVTAPAQVREVQAAGGRLIVSPHLAPDVVDEALGLGLVCLPGVFTPTEVMAALARGVQGVKLFPAEVLQPAGLKALRAVLPAQAVLLPVGGIEAAQLRAWRDAGASGAGVGSAVYRPGRPPDEVARLAQALARAWAVAGQPAGTDAAAPA